MSCEGICCLRADHAPIRWLQPDFEQIRLCLSGKLRLLVEDSHSEQTIIEALPGEGVYLPAGYAYTVEPTGVDTVFFWTFGTPDQTNPVEAPEPISVENVPPPKFEPHFDTAMNNRL